MPVLVDSSLWVHQLRKSGDPAKRDRVNALLESGEAAWCPAVRLELWRGVTNDAERKTLRRYEASLPDYEISFWYGFFVPTGTPREIVQRLHQETAKALALPEVGKSLGREGTETAGSRSPDEFAAFIAEDAKLWARLVKDSGAKAD